MRKLLASVLGLGFMAAASISVANAQSTFYPGSPGSPYTTGSLKRHIDPAWVHLKETAYRPVRACRDDLGTLERRLSNSPKPDQ